MKPDVEVLIKPETAQYTLIARKFGIVVRSLDISAGFKEVEARIADVKRELLNADVDLGHTETESATESRWFGIVLPIVVSCLVPWSVIALLLFLATAPIATAMSGAKDWIAAARDSSHGNASELGHLGVNLIVHAGETVDQLTPARKEELRGAVRKIVSAVAPLADELRPLFVDPKSRKVEP